MTSVQLVCMPFAAVERPSLALGLLQASLQRAGIACAGVYANMYFADAIGPAVAAAIGEGYTGYLVGEWLFSRAAFPTAARDDAAYLARIERVFGPGTRLRNLVPAAALTQLMIAWRDAAELFVEELADALVAQRPRIVGCSSTFQQHCASLALLRAIRTRSPEIVTLLGGANCEGRMGAVVTRCFDWVDVVVSGESDELIAPLCQALLARGRSVTRDQLPVGALLSKSLRDGRHLPTMQTCAAPPRAQVADLDALPIPDFDDYFQTLDALSCRDRISPGLVVETSRGCWWGAIRHCTFCGLNGSGMRHRSKSSQRALAELDSLAERYQIRGFQVADNIVDMDYFKTVLPELARRGAPYRLFYETKANLKREQVALLARSGVEFIQPGIEALHDGLLRLIDKGCTAIANVQLLKWAREFDLSVMWILMFDIPGERDEWYAETAAWLEQIEHLQPPGSITQLQYHRFSPYHERPEDFGLTLAPEPWYRYIYPLADADLADLAYYFTACGERRPSAGPGSTQLTELALRWQARYWAGDRASRPLLEMHDRDRVLHIRDTRICALAREHQLVGLEREVYLACDAAVTRAALARRLAARGDDGPKRSATGGAIDSAIDKLVRARLLLRLGGRLLALAIPQAEPQASQAGRYPGGAIRPRYFPTLEEQMLW